MTHDEPREDEAAMRHGEKPTIISEKGDDRGRSESPRSEKLTASEITRGSANGAQLQTPERLETIEKANGDIEVKHASTGNSINVSGHDPPSTHSQLPPTAPILQLLSSPSIHANPAPIRSTTLHFHHHQYRAARQTKLRNNLLLIVGFLEFSNALDFPANVWNNIPIPLFAVVLMAVGGSIAILVSFCAFYDLKLGWRNFVLLKQERRYLLELKDKVSGEHQEERTRMCKAWIDLNFREMGWEFMDRMCMDSLNGFAGILVGAGTILAIGGANPKIFKASNLLSGYIGNGFNVLYGILNTAWSVYMWKRSRMLKHAFEDCVKNVRLKKRLKGHTRRHGTYAVIQGLTVFVGAIGSMVSATMWQGYVVLIPCVVGGVVSNILWRRGIGYDRELASERHKLLDMDVERELTNAIRAREAIENKGSEIMLEGCNGSEIINFMIENELFEEFCLQLLRGPTIRRRLLGVKFDWREVAVDQTMVESLEGSDLIKHAKLCLSKRDFCFRDQERMLGELWGYLLLRGSRGEHFCTVAESPTEKEA